MAGCFRTMAGYRKTAPKVVFRIMAPVFEPLSDVMGKGDLAPCRQRKGGPPHTDGWPPCRAALEGGPNDKETWFQLGHVL
jgi:hypothetical protein